MTDTQDHAAELDVVDDPRTRSPTRVTKSTCPG